ncbi:uncharacterized protein LOC130677241 [Microplitis mediator]|uniref:uncharacterized protein LOC130677241 n=1 Tax=Microplitis mediator TaxID=375433 RepID=UPI002553A9BA|nr:uncharacterized protein LOC130677241 [Microplitis mediator]
MDMLNIVDFIYLLLIITIVLLIIRILTELKYEFETKKSNLLSNVDENQLPDDTALDDYNASVERLERLLANLRTRDEDYESVADKINDESWNSSDDFNDFFDNVGEHNDEIELIIKVIEYCHSNPEKKTEYYPTVDTKVNKLADKLSTADLTVGKTVDEIVDNFNDLQHFALKLLAMYIYFGEDESVKEKCRREILRFIPAVDKFINQNITDPTDIVRLTVFRLLANDGYDNDKFKTDFHDLKVRSAVESFLILETRSTDELGEECLYSEDSYLARDNLVDYTKLLVSASMSERALIKFKYPSAKYKRIEVILTKLLHPTIPYLPFGVIGFTGNRYNFINDLGWDVKGNLGVYTFPFIGLGVFKTEKFMFSLRVQRDGIPISLANDKKCAELSLGWLQMRKMYVNGYSYDRELTWDKLKNEPGVLTIDEKDYQHLLAEDIFGNGKVYNCVNIDSFIGQLTKHKLMFWGNNYKFETFYGDCTIKEVGVVTNNGAQISYSIENKSAKVLKFRWKDDYSGFSEHKVTGASTEDNFVVVNPKGGGDDYVPTKFTLHMMIEGKEDYQVIIGDSKDKMLTFRYAGENYYVERIYEDSELFKCSAKVNDSAKPSYVIAGSTSGLADIPLEFKGKRYSRDKETLMYIIKSK